MVIRRVMGWLALSSDSDRNAPIEGIRAVSVLLVMLYHAGAPLMTFGWMGVDVFFVLSGFLITTLLLHEVGRSGRIDIRAFLIRRALRIFPVYFFFITIITLLIALGVGEIYAHRDGWTLTHYLLGLWTYTANYIPLGGIWEHQRMTGQVWSLAVEEQFYIAYPFVLTLFAVLCRNWLHRCALLLAALAVFYVLSDVIWPLIQSSRGLSIVVGCAVAMAVLGLDRLPLSKTFVERLLFALALLGLAAAIGATIALAYWNLEAHYPRRASSWAWRMTLWTGAAFAIAGFWRGLAMPGRRVLSWPFLQLTGKISYGLYIYHLMIYVLVWRIGGRFFVSGVYGEADYALRFLIYMALTYAAALASYRYIEKPFLDMKDRLSARARAAIA